MPLLFTDARFLDHDTGRHPERAARLVAIADRLKRSDLLQRYQRGTCRPATREELERVHAPRHITAVEQFATHGGGRIEIDTVVSPGSYEVAVLAAGAAVSAVEAVLGGRDQRAVCLVRPPGHHALPEHPMGFCLFNSIAVAARSAQAAFGLERLLIVDFDVHHGNGTQETFYRDGAVCVFSVHRSPFYPGTGAEDEAGSGPGLGTNFNLPLPFGVSRREYRERFHAVLEEVASRSRPELILLSAGFDAHAADPIGSLGLESEDFGELTRLVCAAANQHCGGRIVSLLEGGYDLDALAESVECHLRTLLET